MLYTRCPNCQTTFRITADTLRVARGAVRCGNCATVYSAFSGLSQEALDAGMQPGEDFLSPTLQTQELAAIEDIASPDVEEIPVTTDEQPQPAVEDAVDLTEVADERVEPRIAEPAAAPPTIESDRVAQAGAEAPSATAPAGPGVDAEPVEPASADSDDVEFTLAAETDVDEDLGDEHLGDEHSNATSDELQFDVPDDDDWTQLLKEIEESSTDDDSTEALPNHDEDAVALGDEELGPTETDDEPLPEFWDIDEPDALDRIGTTTTAQNAREPSDAGVAQTGGVDAAAALETEMAVEHDDSEEPISAEEIDATLSEELDADILTALEAGLGSSQPDKRRSRVWPIGAACLAVLLVGQLVHHNRALLATQPLVGPVLQSAYAVFGVELAPNWDLDQYEISNWAATAGETEGGVGNLRITAQIRNGGPAAQPFPSIQLELKDRWEAVIGSRVFTPREYLSEDIDADQLMTAGQSVPAQLAVVDPGLDASGFELDVCLASGSDSYRCSADRVFE